VILKAKYVTIILLSKASKVCRDQSEYALGHDGVGREQGQKVYNQLIMKRCNVMENLLLVLEIKKELSVSTYA
jgi:hypothetical protein